MDTIKPPSNGKKAVPPLLSIFCGAGGLDLGFEAAGFTVGLAFDNDSDSVTTYNHNRSKAKAAHRADIESLTLKRLDKYWGGTFAPIGLIGGPPCQSFSDANPNADDDDPRHLLPLAYAKLLKRLNRRSPVSFFVLENVTGLASKRHEERLKELVKQLSDAGFIVSQQILDSEDFGVPQFRSRLFLVGFNKKIFGETVWRPPIAIVDEKGWVSVEQAIGKLPEPTQFSRGLKPDDIPHHRNHWCMRPKSEKFSKGTLRAGNSAGRSFKTLSLSKPSITIAFGHREVHVHPNCKRRLSVYEAMLLQSFPSEYELIGNLSSQITQVSNAVPPLLAEAVAVSITTQIGIGPVLDLANNSSRRSPVSSQCELALPVSV